MAFWLRSGSLKVRTRYYPQYVSKKSEFSRNHRFMSNRSSNKFEIRNATELDLGFIHQAVANEGWEPGQDDVQIYNKLDPQGFFVGLLNNQIIGCISGVKYDQANFGFIGFYIMNPIHRGNGYGMKLFKAVLSHLSGTNIALDALMSQIPKYSKAGFKTSHFHLKYKGIGPFQQLSNNQNQNYEKQIIEASKADFNEIKTFLRKHFVCDRDLLLEGWLKTPKDRAKYLIFLHDEEILGFGGIRKSTTGYRIAPLYASNVEIAKALMIKLTSNLHENEMYFLDVPNINEEAIHLFKDMNQIFQVARMYTKEPPHESIHWNQVFSVSALTIG